MSVRLKSFTKGHLDALAAAVDCPAFGWADAAMWDKDTAYGFGARVHDANGFYFKAKMPTPAVGTPPTHPGYWDQDPPDWRGQLNTVRDAFQAKLYATAKGYGPMKGLRLMETAVVSGPWELGIAGYDGGGVRLTHSLQNIGEGVVNPWTCECYAFKEIELLSERSDCRLDIQAGFGSTFASVVGGLDPAPFLLKLGFNVSGYVTGSVQVNVTGTETPGYSTGATWNPTLRLLSWDYSNALMPGIDCNASIVGGSFEIVGISLLVTWTGLAAVAADNVVSAAPVYRGRCCATLPHVALTKLKSLYDSDTGLTTAIQVSYADGANCAVMQAVPVNYIADVPPYGRWRMRAKTLPASNVRYITESPPTLATGITAPLNQRQWYMCRRADDGRTITPNAAQSAIREIDTLFAHRDASDGDQTTPVTQRIAMATTRTSLSAAVGFMRSGDVDPRLLATVTLPGDRWNSERYLGRSAAIIIWDALPLLWYGADRAALWISATGPVACWTPNASHDTLTGLCWTNDPGLGDTTPIGFLYCAAQLYDDLMAVQEAMRSAGSAPVDLLGRVSDLGRISENPYAAA